MDDVEEGGGIAQTLAIGCPIAIGMALIVIVLVVLIGAVLLAFAF
jgi:hypothetical protein